jgi:hypothetical protein
VSSLVAPCGAYLSSSLHFLYSYLLLLMGYFLFHVTNHSPFSLPLRTQPTSQDLIYIPSPTEKNIWPFFRDSSISLTHSYSFYYFFFLAVLGLEFRASHLLDTR